MWVKGISAGANSHIFHWNRFPSEKEKKKQFKAATWESGKANRFLFFGYNKTNKQYFIQFSFDIVCISLIFPMCVCVRVFVQVIVTDNDSSLWLPLGIIVSCSWENCFCVYNLDSWRRLKSLNILKKCENLSLTFTNLTLFYFSFMIIIVLWAYFCVFMQFVSLSLS